MANQQALIYKLQLALKQKGYIISINTTQFYSGDRGRYIKGYILKRNYKIVYSSYSTIRIIRYLVNLLNIVKTLNTQEIQSRRIDTIIEQRMEEIYKCQKQLEERD